MPLARPATTGVPFQSASEDHQPEALAQRLLEHDLGQSLEGVDFDVADPGEIGEEVDIRIIQRHRAGQRQLQVGHFPSGGPVSGDDAERVLPRVEAADLGDQWPVYVDPDPLEDAAGKVRVEVDILRALGGNRRRDGGAASARAD